MKNTITLKVTNTELKFNYSKDFDRYESELMTDSGYFARFIICRHRNENKTSKRKYKGWNFRIHNEVNDNDESGYGYTAWCDNYGETIKNLEDILNQYCDNILNCTKWSRGRVNEAA